MFFSKRVVSRRHGAYIASQATAVLSWLLARGQIGRKDLMPYPACARTNDQDQPPPRARWFRIFAFLVLALALGLTVWKANQDNAPNDHPSPTTSSVATDLNLAIMLH